MSDSVLGIPGVSPVQGGVSNRDGVHRSSGSVQSSEKSFEPLSATTQTSAKTGELQISWALLEQVLPLSILKEPGLQVAEWAWRRLVVEALVGTFSGHQDVVTGPSTNPTDKGAIMLQSGLLTRTLKALWTNLDDLALQADDASSIVLNLMSGHSHISALTQFSHWSGQDAATVPSQVKAWVLLDRWLASVPWVAGTFNGAGLYQPPTRTAQLEYWRGWRDTRKVGNKFVHRLVLHLHLPQGACQITLLAAKPEVSVFVATESESLQKWVVDHQGILRGVLDKQGWTLQRCVGTPMGSE
ncbi:hypothetical protein D2Q93_00715 [Alicyclobacillaceae bacterium I2511]|nr:hypothetical protein D2Q93_00715 [Alicyclobacillaceae bacterium I2511]